MNRFGLRVAGIAIAVLVLFGASTASAIETTYGEDPVPNMHPWRKPPFQAYGMDPVPDKSPLTRIQDYRNTRAASERQTSAPEPRDDRGWKWRRRGH